MLTESQMALMDELTDEFVDNQTVVDEEQVNILMADIEANLDRFDKWNVWNTVSGGSSAPAISGSSQTPPSCTQNGNSPCASCDCC